jgi:phosphoribosylformimino-5-aminoimidazole carboxamide ribotide isomerase
MLASFPSTILTILFSSVSSVANLQLIPVVDLKGGMVVHAREGRRAEYRPVQSRLCDGADTETVVDALLGVHPFRSLYVADLDAIQRQGSNLDTLKRIRRRFPHLDLWVDSGIADERGLDAWLRASIGRAVIGSESLLNAEFISLARKRCGDLSPVLSLDFIGEEFKGPQALLADPARYWPERVLAMNLRRVGSDAGPDLALIATLAAKAPNCEVYAAGGVRSVDDLERVAAAGAAGALIATALHDGRLGPAHLAQFT